MGDKKKRKEKKNQPEARAPMIPAVSQSLDFPQSFPFSEREAHFANCQHDNGILELDFRQEDGKEASIFSSTCHIAWQIRSCTLNFVFH
jgi:hypothetical protein